MKYIAAYALLVLGGKENPTAADVEKLLKEAGVAAETESIERLIAAFEGKKFNEAVAGGLAKMATMGSAAPAATGAAAAEEAPVEEDKKEEEEDVDMGGPSETTMMTTDPTSG